MADTAYHIKINEVVLEIVSRECHLKVQFTSGDVTFDCVPISAAPGAKRRLTISRSGGTLKGAGSGRWTPDPGPGNPTPAQIKSQIYDFSASESIEYLDPGGSPM